VFDYNRFPKESSSQIRKDGTVVTVKWPPYEVDVKRDSSFSELALLANQETQGSDPSTSSELLNHLIHHLATPLCQVRVGKHKKLRPARIIVLGDCHPLLFVGGHGAQQARAGSDSYNETSESCGLSNYRVCAVAGASAHGLGNSFSHTGAAYQFQDCVRRWGADADFVAIQIGDVDLRNVARFRQSSKNITMLEQIQTSVDNLLKFVQEVLVDIHHFEMKQIVLLGTVFLCPVSQQQERNDQKLPRKGDYLTHSTATATMKYHDTLRRRCKVSRVQASAFTL
jgi:hypothetical protein